MRARQNPNLPAKMRARQNLNLPAKIRSRQNLNAILCLTGIFQASRFHHWSFRRPKTLSALLPPSPGPELLVSWPRTQRLIPQVSIFKKLFSSSPKFRSNKLRRFVQGMFYLGEWFGTVDLLVLTSLDHLLLLP